jgi:hypothetical protein
MAAVTIIRPATMEEYLGSRAHRFSSDALAFDDPDWVVLRRELPPPGPRGGEGAKP